MRKDPSVVASGYCRRNCDPPYIEKKYIDEYIGESLNSHGTVDTVLCQCELSVTSAVLWQHEPSVRSRKNIYSRVS